MARSVAAFGDLKLMKKKKRQNNLCDDPRCYYTAFHKQWPRVLQSSSHNDTITAQKEKEDLITDKTLLLFHKEHLQQMLRDKQKQNNCRLEDAESKKKLMHKKETAGQLHTHTHTHTQKKQAATECTLENTSCTFLFPGLFKALIFIFH